MRLDIGTQCTQSGQKPAIPPCPRPSHPLLTSTLAVAAKEQKMRESANTAAFQLPLPLL